ncbi:MAG: tRNA preQ1(34) S-adenosylmethionine ribosyltransferase-isomerase QueA [Desertifilum sp. SIO1I2]|nr:tRNA preQ1(34) S-adenosylmethionine ribosyltransferase-isomerase QueA [Desertifilum sp. SIO1I2]
MCPVDFDSAPSFSTDPNSGEIDRNLNAYDYELPLARIAQNPVNPRDRSRLLVVDSPTQHQHRLFCDLPELLQPGDLLVLNNTRVLPARLYGCKSTGAPVEVLLLERQQNRTWLALVKPGRRVKIGAQLIFHPLNADGGDPLCAKVIARDDATGGRLLEFDIPEGESLEAQLDRYGRIPLPPYITESEALPEQYQTVYAQQPGSAAAPTAGLHFTPELLQRLQERQIETAYVTLHVGVGTFRPVEVEDITQHTMHSEWLEVSPEVVEKIQQTQAKGGRVIAVGTTAVRALEGTAAVAQQQGESTPLVAHEGKTNLFIYPGYQWQVVDGLITNFHLPRSSLLMLVSALIGRQRLLDLYAEAIAQEYRFYSFGDAMLILPEARQYYRKTD